MNLSTLPINEVVSGGIALILTVAVALSYILHGTVPMELSGAFLLVLGFYFRAQGFNAGVDHAVKMGMSHE